MHNVVQFIREHSLSRLCEQFTISARRHAQFPNLVQLKYSQIDSPMGEPIVRECRGLIVDETDDWKIVAAPYGKFFNFGEGHAAPIDWPTARVYEKLDGSLMYLYFYRGEWRVASSGLPDAAGRVHESEGTFADLFWKTWRQLGYSMPAEQASDQTLLFELMSPLNRVIVPHAQPRLVLHGARSRLDGREFRPEEIATRYGWECARSFPLATLDDCLAAAHALDPMKFEGYVVCDGNFNRVKVKSPQYVALAHLKGALSGRRFLEIIRANESDEFVAYFPEWRHAYDHVRREFDGLCAALEADFSRLKEIPDQKTFAAEAMKTRCSGALFAMRKGTSRSAREYFGSCTIHALERAIVLKESDLKLPATAPPE